MTELWQLYDEQGRPLPGKGGTKDIVYTKALLHGASHVWIWRKKENKVQVLLQKRAADKRTWPNYYDISAAGHIDLGEDPLTAAVRETQEEIGFDVTVEDLQFIGVDRRNLAVANNNKLRENELCWLYTLRLDQQQDFTLADGEVDSLVWKDLDIIKNEFADKDKYVPHGNTYYSIVFEAIERRDNE